MRSLSLNPQVFSLLLSQTLPHPTEGSKRVTGCGLCRWLGQPTAPHKGSAALEEGIKQQSGVAKEVTH